MTVALAEKMVAARGEGERIRVRGTTDRGEVLPGAHVVICSVGVGGRPGWQKDWEIAAEFGISKPASATPCCRRGSRAPCAPSR